MALTWIRTHDWDADEWRDRAACRDTDPELFFPIGTTGLAIDQIEAARTVCLQCPVRQECLEFALATNQEAGVWGATTEDQTPRALVLRSARESETGILADFFSLEAADALRPRLRITYLPRATSGLP